MSKVQSRKFLFSLVIAFLIGIAQIYILLKIYSFFIVYSPPMEWLYNLGFRGAQVKFGTVLIDLVIATVFSFAIAFVLIKLQPHKTWLYVWVAVFTGFFLMEGSLLINVSRLVELWPGVMIGWINLLLPIPLAVLLLRKAMLSKAPDKPMNTNDGDAGVA